MANSLAIKKRRDERVKTLYAMEVGTTTSFPASDESSIRDITRSFNTANIRNYTTKVVDDTIYITRLK